MKKTITIEEGEDFGHHLRDPNLTKLTVIVKGDMRSDSIHVIIPTPLTPKIMDCISPMDFNVRPTLCRYFFHFFKYNGHIKTLHGWLPL